jgi:maltooligosyltrehalose trehalohydrolase
MDLEPWNFVIYLQNHDQVANSLSGLRADRLAGPGKLRALTALLLLAPASPMLFQGQEFGASSPFLYFADHNPELAALVAKGRGEFLCQFKTFVDAQGSLEPIQPHLEETFHRSKLDLRERETHRATYLLHKDLIRLRRNDPVFSRPRRQGVDGAVLGPDAFVLRFFAGDGKDRLLLVNLGVDVKLSPAPEPLLAPLPGNIWRVKWSSEDPRYGGSGTPPLGGEASWWIPGNAALVLYPEEMAKSSHGEDHSENRSRQREG